MKKFFIIGLICIPFLNAFPQAWFIQNSGVTQNLYSIYFCNPNTGLAAGDNGTIIKTTNGGQNWIQIACPVNTSLTYLRAYSPDSCLAASNTNDTVLFTTNGGVNWILREVSSTYLSYTNDVNFVNFNTGFYYKSGYLFRTADAGLSWTNYYVTSGVRNISFVNANTGWICRKYTIPYPPPYGTSYSEILVTYNGGANWTLQLSVQELSYSIYRIFMRNASDGLMNDASSNSFGRTVNGGVNWNAGSTGAGAYKMYFRMSFPTNSTGFFTGDKTIKTTNGGANWNELSTPHSAQTYEDVFFINENTGWLAGTGGVIVKTISGGVTSVPENNNTPLSFKLYQNYPNPFNQSTIISFQNLFGGYISLKIYDIRGKEVASLINEKRLPGSYDTRFNGAGLSNGVYFYRLLLMSEEQDDYIMKSEIKKMLIVK